MGQTLDYGIDLGTTNSVICRLHGVEPDVLKNNLGSEITPSVLMIDKKDRLIVGRDAKVRQDSDPGNVAFEFKRWMGEDRPFRFERSGRTMQPDELSAEVLKDLKGTAKQRTGDVIPGAVITVPAAFRLPQCEATKQAAQQAGFAYYPLLQEPVAAALAYGAHADTERVYWLAFDLGGGTFDAALINMRDGMFNIVNHLGDNDLGGQLIDWDIVNDLLIPTVTRNRKLTDFNRGNPKWRQAFAKLKLAAEEAKIRLSGNQDSTDIDVDFLCNDDRGEPVDFLYELQRADVERLAEPYVRRTIVLARKTFEQKRLGPGNIEKILLVGGPTLMPYLRERLADATEGLGIPLALDRDPLTAVAQGAAIFGGGQRIEDDETVTVPDGFAVELEYRPVDSDPEPMIGGRVVANGVDVNGYTVEFVNGSVQPTWRSGRVTLGQEGVFATQLYAEKGVENTFAIEVRTAEGDLVPTTPEQFSYRVMISAIEAPLALSIGVGLADNKVRWFARRGEPLPFRGRRILKTALDLKRGTQSALLRIPLVEGESDRADRNEVVGTLNLQPVSLARDLPAGSDVEVTVAIDASRLMTMSAYIPILDEEFEKVFDYKDFKAQSVDVEQLRQSLKDERRRLADLETKTNDTGAADARAALDRVIDDRMFDDVERALDTVGDGTAAMCQSRLREVQVALDQAEELLAWPLLVANAQSEIEMERDIIGNSAYNPTPVEITEFDKLERETRRAIKERNQDLLRTKLNELDRLGITIVMREPGWWVAHLHHLEEKRHILSDQGTADLCLSRANRAIQNNDVEGLKQAVRQLWRLLPAGDPDRLKFDASTVTE